MKYQLNLITPLGTLVSEEYETELGVGMDQAEAKEIADFSWSRPYGFRTATGVKAVIGSELAKNSMLLIKEFEDEDDNHGNG